MTTWIGTDEVGYDTNSIAFESIQGCTGLVLQTDHWLAGWHIGGEAHGSQGIMVDGKATFLGSAFLTYIRQNIPDHPWPPSGPPPEGENILLWNIFNNHMSWKDELDDFGRILQYRGPAFGFNLLSKIGMVDSSDIVITKIGATCQIQYKRTRKMIHQKRSDVQFAVTNVKKIKGNSVQAPFIDDIAQKGVDSAKVKATYFNKGLMHIAANKNIMAHTVNW